MDYQYKIIVSNKKIYREFELGQDAEKVRLGTTAACEFRLSQAAFFCDIELEFNKSNGKWELFCSDDLYISKGDMRKLISVELEHGDIFDVKYAVSGDEVFEIRFMIDFEAKVPNYNWKVELSEKEKWVIADGEHGDIYLKSEFSKGTVIQIVKENSNYVVQEIRSEFGVYLNGQRKKDAIILKDYDFISVADFSFYYKEGNIYVDIDNIKVNATIISEVISTENSLKYPLFNRNTRLKNNLIKEKIDILVPPEVPQKPEDNIFMTVLPTLAMLVLTIVVRGFMSKTSNMQFILFSVCSMSLGVFTSIATFVRSRKKYRNECQERIEQYISYIEGKREEISKLRQDELDILNDIYHDINYDIDVVDRFSTELFDRVSQDEDFLKIYIGRGEVLSARQVDYKEKEAFETNDELLEIPLRIANDFKYIGNAPITVDFNKSDAIGIIGSEVNNYNFMKNIIIDLTTRHYYGDVKLIALLEDNIEHYDWLRFIPHVKNVLAMRNIVHDAETKNGIFEMLYKELSFRKERKDNSKEEYLIILVVDERGLKNHPLSQFIENASALNVTFVFFEQYAEQLPLNCNEIVKLIDDRNGILYDVSNKNYCKKFVYDSISQDEMERFCKKLAPIHCAEISLERSLRKSISLFELLHVYSVYDIDLNDRWANSRIYNSMEVPLGVNSKDEIVYLNLHEKYHGPHGLVAGTTGSGKSEILQTYILSAATLFHPYEISFVIIDFKGGGMVNQFKNLPHLIGAITNIDGREIERSLKSIKAELLKRQTLFAEANVNHIDKYIKLYKEGSVKVALPHLIIIVDEFAELKAEQPEFMKELISAARIGRSLGVHLILATQKPSGQVNEQIWSNSKFKLCLKVQNKEDSNEVLKSPLAAEIKEPGRAYLQVGNNEIFELLQSAYSGAPDKSENNAEKEFYISEVQFAGKRKKLFEKKGNKTSEESHTQLEVLVDYVADYCKKMCISKLPDICLPPLADNINITTSLKDYSLNSIPVGIYDDPDSQYQGEALFNFCENNTMIIGSSATGKTNLLQTIIRQMATKFSPKEINIYIMDFGAMYLKNFEKLKHIGGIVTISDEDKLRNLFKMLLEEIQIRKAKFLQMGISSFAAYKEAGYTDFPQIILMIDNFTAFKEVYAESYEDNFVHITREGLACGISVIVTNSQTSGLGYKYMSNFACRLALHCNDSAEYGSLFERCRIQPKDVPGRALCKINKELFELQTFLAFEGSKEIERSNAVRQFIQEINARWNVENAKTIPEIPNILDCAYIQQNCKYKDKIYTYPIGLDYSTVDVVSLDFRQINELSVIGNEPSLRVNAIGAVLETVEFNLKTKMVKVFIVDNVERALKSKAEKSFVENYTIDHTAIEGMISNIAEELEKRYSILVSEGIEALEKLPMYMVVVNNRDAIEYISSTKSVLEMYNKIMKQYKSLGICFVYSDIEDVPVAYGGPELMKRLKEGKKALITTRSLKDFKFCEIASNVIRNTKELKDGDAYFLNGTNVQRIKLVKMSKEDNC